VSKRNNKEDSRSHPLQGLLQSTTPQQEITAAPPPASPPSVIPTQEQGAQPPVQQQSTVQRPAPPETRTRTGRSFNERYRTESISVDRRLLPYYYQLIESYPNKTIAMNEAIVEACKKRGISVPENWNVQPYPSE